MRHASRCCVAWLLLTAMGAGSAVAQSRTEAKYVGRPLTDVLRGSIDGLTPEQALEAILPTCGLAHRIANGTVTIDRGSAR